MTRTLFLAIALCLPAAARAQSAPCAPRPELEVATLNTWGLPFPLSTERRRRFEEIRAYLAGGVDIVGLQEVWRGALHLLPHHLRVADDLGGDSGLAVVTPLATTRPVLRRYRGATGPDRMKTKGALTTKVALPDGDATWVVVTHLQAGRSPRAAEVRSEQVRELIDVVAGLDGPAVVMGDFNLYDDLSDDLTSAGRLARAGMVDVAVATGEATATYAADGSRLDRIYVRSADGEALAPIRVSVPSGKGLSDHAPVEATIARCLVPRDPVASR